MKTKLNQNDLAKAVAAMEGKHTSLGIGQIKEVMRCTFLAMREAALEATEGEGMTETEAVVCADYIIANTVKSVKPK